MASSSIWVASHFSQSMLPVFHRFPFRIVSRSHVLLAIACYCIQPCPDMMPIMMGDEIIVVGLTTRGELFLDSTSIMNNCNSFGVHEKFLLATTHEYVLCLPTGWAFLQLYCNMLMRRFFALALAVTNSCWCHAPSRYEMPASTSWLQTTAWCVPY